MYMYVKLWERHGNVPRVKESIATAVGGHPYKTVIHRGHCDHPITNSWVDGCFYGCIKRLWIHSYCFRQVHAYTYYSIKDWHVSCIGCARHLSARSNLVQTNHLSIGYDNTQSARPHDPVVVTRLKSRYTLIGYSESQSALQSLRPPQDTKG